MGDRADAGEVKMVEAEEVSATDRGKGREEGEEGVDDGGRGEGGGAAVKGEVEGGDLVAMGDQERARGGSRKGGGGVATREREGEGAAKGRRGIAISREREGSLGGGCYAVGRQGLGGRGNAGGGEGGLEPSVGGVGVIGGVGERAPQVGGEGCLHGGSMGIGRGRKHRRGEGVSKQGSALASQPARLLQLLRAFRGPAHFGHQSIKPSLLKMISVFKGKFRPFFLPLCNRGR